MFWLFLSIIAIGAIIYIQKNGTATSAARASILIEDAADHLAATTRVVADKINDTPIEEPVIKATTVMYDTSHKAKETLANTYVKTKMATRRTRYDTKVAIAQEKARIKAQRERDKRVAASRVNLDNQGVNPS